MIPCAEAIRCNSFKFVLQESSPLVVVPVIAEASSSVGDSVESFGNLSRSPTFD